MLHVLAYITAKPGMREAVLREFRANIQASLFGRFRSSEFRLSGVMALTLPRALASLRNRRTGPSITGLEE
jgi:hypothetical protein